MKKNVITAVLTLIVFTIFLGFIYPLVITGIAQVMFPFQSNGSLIIKDGHIIGSELIGQSFTDIRYFHGRPSSINYDASNSGGSNFGPMNKTFMKRIEDQIKIIRADNNLSSDLFIPGDIITSSASGLDPHISPESAKIQINRIARIRGIPKNKLDELIMTYMEHPISGGHYVNVLKLNLALDMLGAK